MPRPRVSGAIGTWVGAPLRTRDTVLCDTWAAAAMSRMVTTRPDIASAQPEYDCSPRRHRPGQLGMVPVKRTFSSNICSGMLDRSSSILAGDVHHGTVMAWGGDSARPVSHLPVARPGRRAG